MTAQERAACEKAIAQSMADRKQACKASEFGCPQCLWASIECRGMSKYSPRVVFTTDGKLKGHESCGSYNYCD